MAPCLLGPRFRGDDKRCSGIASMFRRDTPAEAQFRSEVRTWLEANLPLALRGRTARPPPAELMPWYRTLSRKGWIAPHWPEQYGGMGATLNEQLIMTEEMARIGAPQLPAQGLNHIGPILMEFGTEAQKAQHLPPIIAGTVIWAQGYSEPGAGSDLASLSTRATLEDDHFVVRGHKIWTTWAHHSDWMFALVRTDPQAQPRHAGISFLLIDLHSPGIRIRPIKTIVGDEEFSEVFFDDVVVPAGNLVGKLHDGWRVRHHRGCGFPRSSRGGQHQRHGAVGAVQPCRGAHEPREKPRAGIIRDQDCRVRASSDAHRSIDRGGRRPRAGGRADREQFRRGDCGSSVPSVASRDNLRRLIRDSAQRPRPPRLEPSKLTGGAIVGHGSASDIGANAVARQRRQIRRGGGAESVAPISRAGSELRAGTAAAGGGTRVARHPRSEFDEWPRSGPHRARAGA